MILEKKVTVAKIKRKIDSGKLIFDNRKLTIDNQKLITNSLTVNKMLFSLT